MRTNWTVFKFEEKSYCYYLEQYANHWLFIQFL